MAKAVSSAAPALSSPGPGTTAIGLRLAGRERRAERHIGGALLVAGVDGAQPVGELEQRLEQEIVLHARQRIDGVEAVGDQRRDRPLRPPSSVAAVAALAAFFRRFGILAPCCGVECADRRAVCRGNRLLRRLVRRRLTNRRGAMWLCATFHPHHWRNRGMHRYRTHTCGALRDERHRHRGPAVRAGAIASATMAACCSSICATITASPRWWPTPTARPSRWPKRCARNGWCASTARCAGGRTAPKIPNCRPARSRSISARSRCWGRPANCRCRCSASRNIPRISGSNTASSTCAASSCTTTS